MSFVTNLTGFFVNLLKWRVITELTVSEYFFNLIFLISRYVTTYFNISNMYVPNYLPTIL